jgi:hypothetical protein
MLLPRPGCAERLFALPDARTLALFISRESLPGRRAGGPRLLAKGRNSSPSGAAYMEVWADQQPDVPLPKGREDTGRALLADEEHRLLTASITTDFFHLS